MRRSSFFLLVLLSGAVLLSGCLGGQPAQPEGWGRGSGGAEPTVTLPPQSTVEIQVNEKDPIYATLTVVFAGGKGQVAVRDILVRVTTPDGVITEKHLEANKGAEVTFQGSRTDDRLEVFVTLTNGQTYKIIDQMVPYRTRG
ncbi:MAG: hypothetical protein NQU46_04505 [Methanolinea sp.]|nr:hypothetical protein [Methanolinea sp.]